MNITKYNSHHEYRYHQQEHAQPKSGKLRSSCDFCALSKVKCDRGQPQCLRCIRNEVTCHYSQTRPSGKARHIYSTSRPCTARTCHASHEEQQRQSGREGRGAERSRSPSLGLAMTQSQPWAHDSSMVNTSNPGIGGGGPADNILKQLPMALFEPTSLMSSPSLEAPTVVSFSNEFPHHQRCTSTAQWDTDTENQNRRHNDQFTPFSLDLGGGTSSCMSKDTITNSEAIAGPESEDCMRRALSEDCMRRALSALNSFHVPAESKLNGEHVTGCKGHPLPCSLDATLTSNRAAMDKICLVLSCSCSKSSNILLLVAFTIQQVLDSYCSLAKMQLFLLSSPAAGEEQPLDTAGGSREREASLAENVPPVAIGSYVVDGEAKNKAILQVLQTETKVLGGLIDSLVSLSTHAAPKETTGNACDAFISSLQARYQGIIHSLYL